MFLGSPERRSQTNLLISSVGIPWCDSETEGRGGEDGSDLREVMFVDKTSS